MFTPEGGLLFGLGPRPHGAIEHSESSIRIGTIGLFRSQGTNGIIPSCALFLLDACMKAALER